MKGFLIRTDSHQQSWGFEHIVTVLYILIFIVSIITNALLFTVFLKNKKLRDLSTFLIVQMAGSDVLYLCIVGITVIIKMLEVEPSRSACKTLLYLEGVCRLASSLSLLLISLERSVSVCSPTLCYSIRKISGVKVKAFVTVVSLALTLRCGVIFVACEPQKWSPGYRLAVIAATYIIPLVVEMVAYLVAYHKIQRRIRNHTRSGQVLLFIKKSLKVFVLIAVVFAVCTLPTSILAILQSLRVYTPSFFLAYLVDMIECIPCVTNVVCYLVCSPKFRLEIKKLFPGRGKKEAQKRSPDPGRGEDEEHNEPCKKDTIDRATMKLDWVLGDDPSQVEIPRSPPATERPLVDIPSTLVEEKEEGGLSTTEEHGEAPFPVISMRVPYGTWPRRKHQRLIESEIELKRTAGQGSAGRSNDVTDSGVSQSGSETGPGADARSPVEKVSTPECSRIAVHAIVHEESSWL